uniref:WD repeat-containing protein 55 homolog n=1 Tax=Anopheles atroparvus TaxID=41427 RepID=A0AAG5D9W5_ANOAO
MRNFRSPHFRESISDSEDEDLDQLAEPYMLDADIVEVLGGDFQLVIGNIYDMENEADSSDSESQGSIYSPAPQDANDSDSVSDSNLHATSSDSEDAHSDGGQGADELRPSDRPGMDALTDSDSGSTSEDKAPHRAIDDYDEEMEEDEVVKAIIAEIKKPRSKPPDIKMDDFVVDLSFHPSEDVLAIGTSVGDVLIYKYANEENTLSATHELHTKAVRALEFNRDGSALISTGRERSILVADIETGKLKWFVDDAHEEPVYSMGVLGEHLFATGDDDGTLKLWDVRQKESVFSLKPVEDFISSILSTHQQQKYLLMTSGDGLLTTINIAQRKLYVQSEPYEEELNCMATFKRESKLVVGTSKGNFYTFNWGQFAYHCDAFTGPPACANRMVPITEQIAITAGEDGVIRAMHVVPGRVLGIVGQHSMAVDTMDISGTGELIATSSHDNDVRFWNIKYFEDFDDIKYNSKPDKRALKHNLPSSQRTNAKDFFADLDE